jgi:hypothetical protein
MIALPSLKQAARKAHHAFGSEANTQLALVLIFGMIGLMASTKLAILVTAPDGFDGTHREWLMRSHDSGSDAAA